MIPVVIRKLITLYFPPALVAASILQSPPVLATQLTLQRQLELINIVKQDCGSCHGLTLKGGLGPPLTRSALTDKPPQLLYNTILLGREHTAMPPWDGLLTRQEIAWIVKRLKSGLDEPQVAGHD